MSATPLSLHNDRIDWLPWLPLLVAVLNSYGRAPLNYGFALYFLNYRHGFVKRGLVGQMFSSARFLSGRSLIAIEYGFLAVAFAMTYLVFCKLLFGNRDERRIAAALLCGPALLSHLGYMFEQPDVALYILLLLCVGLFLVNKPQVAVIASCPVCCVALLGHEAFSLMFYPLIAAILLHLCLRGRLTWAIGLAHVAVVATVFVAVLHWGKLKISPDAMLREAQARTNVGVERQVYDVMASTLAQQRMLVHRMYTPWVWTVLAVTLVLSLPYFMLLARLLCRTIWLAGGGGFQIAVTALLFLLPLSLSTLGHDTTRWIGATCIDTTFFLLYLCLSEPAGSPVRAHLASWTEGPTYIPWLVYVVAIGPYGATGIRAAEQHVATWF